MPPEIAVLPAPAMVRSWASPEAMTLPVTCSSDAAEWLVQVWLVAKSTSAAIKCRVADEAASMEMLLSVIDPLDRVTLLAASALKVNVPRVLAPPTSTVCSPARPVATKATSSPSWKPLMSSLQFVAVPHKPSPPPASQVTSAPCMRLAARRSTPISSVRRETIGGPFQESGAPRTKSFDRDADPQGTANDKQTHPGAKADPVRWKLQRVDLNRIVQESPSSLRARKRYSTIAPRPRESRRRPRYARGMPKSYAISSAHFSRISRAIDRSAHNPQVGRSATRCRTTRQYGMSRCRDGPDDL